MPDSVEDKPEYTLGQKEARRLHDMERAFLNRPRLSIRLRIVTGFLLCFFLLAVTGLINLAILYQARGKLHFLDVSQDLSLDVQQARHFERLNYPDRKNLEQAAQAAQEASNLLITEGVNILEVSGQTQLIAIEYKLGHYSQIVHEALAELDRAAPDSARVAALNAELDASSGDIMTLLRTMKATEAASANRVLKISQTLPFLFAGVMLLIIFWITKLLAGTITASLNRLEESTRRIAGGDFSLMNPARKYRDELSDLSLGVNRMLLELRAREAQVIKADRLASVGAFSAGIAQDLNDVFSTISANTRAFMKGCHPKADCPSFSLLEGIFEETERGRETVQGLVEFTHDDEAEVGRVDLGAAVDSARMLLERELTDDRVEFRAEVPEEMPPVRGIFGQLKQVFLNLFHNAVQAMPAGGALTVRVGFLGADRAEVTVSDQGVGIPPGDLPYVFDPFYTTREGSEGTGLGLSISYGIVHRFGGDIRVESVVGQGTTVHVTLPLASVTASDEADERPDERPPSNTETLSPATAASPTANKP
jgi:two-component system NtrC family sensor kinase